MKAVVMAGGEGTRLRPLTSNQPKPMVPIVGKPCMEHILDLLRRHGMHDVVVTLSHAGYAKSQPVTEYQVQRRGGRGKAATSVKDEDFVEKLFVAHTHDTILCFSNRGKVYWKRVFELPQAGRGSRGKPMVNLLPLE